MKNFKTRINLVSLFIFAGFISIGARLFQIQIIQHVFYEKIVAKKVDRIKEINGPRGKILDCRKQPLATTMIAESCFIEPEKVRKYVDARALSKIINMPIEDVNSKLKRRGKHVLLKKNLFPEDVEKVKSAGITVSDKSLYEGGVYFEKVQFRNYDEGALGNYVVGVVGADNMGQAGIERYFNKFLTGNTIKYRTTIDGKGRETSTPKIQDEEKAVVLTIDSNIQYVVERELKKAYLDTNAAIVTAIVQNPQTGEILAMASYPSYDPNLKTKRNLKMLKNPAIANVYEPGSVFKIVAAAAALESRNDVYKDRFYCEMGEYKLSSDITIHDAEHKYGWLTFEEIMAYSSNIGFAKLANGIGKRRLWQYSRLFGFGEKSGIELPGEEKGMMRPLEKWSGVSCQMISFGQEISATPLQIVNAYSAIANGGFLMEPRIVKSLTCNGVTQKEYEPVALRRVASQQTISKVASMLEAAVNYGTGDRAKIPGLRIAGKTGTAQKYDNEQRRYSAKKFVSSFVGFFPAENPKATVLVLVDEPVGDYWAASVAAPVFKRISGGILEYLNVRPVAQIASKQN